MDFMNHVIFLKGYFSGFKSSLLSLKGYGCLFSQMIQVFSHDISFSMEICMRYPGCRSRYPDSTVHASCHFSQGILFKF
jgi:hypothetical protein